MSLVSQPHSTAAFQSTKSYQVSSPGASADPTVGPPSLSQSVNQVSPSIVLAGPPVGPPSFSYQTPANGNPPGPSPGRFAGNVVQLRGQGPRQSIGQPEPLYRPMLGMQGSPSVAPLVQQLQGMTMERTDQSPSGPPGLPSLSAPSQTLAGPLYTTPSSWQTSQRRVYPEAYTGQSLSVSYVCVAPRFYRFCLKL